MVDVSAGHIAFNTRMVLDSGAVMSLVTSKLVNSIRAKMLHTDVAILSLGGTTPTHTKVELILASPTVGAKINFPSPFLTQQ